MHSDTFVTVPLRTPMQMPSSSSLLSLFGVPWTSWTNGTQAPLEVPLFVSTERLGILQLATAAGLLGHSQPAAAAPPCQHDTSYSLSWDILECSYNCFLSMCQQRIILEDIWQPETTHCGVLVSADTTPLPQVSRVGTGINLFCYQESNGELQISQAKLYH